MMSFVSYLLLCFVFLHLPAMPLAAIQLCHWLQVCSISRVKHVVLGNNHYEMMLLHLKGIL